MSDYLAIDSNDSDINFIHITDLFLLFTYSRKNSKIIKNIIKHLLITLMIYYTHYCCIHNLLRSSISFTMMIYYKTNILISHPFKSI